MQDWGGTTLSFKLDSNEEKQGALEHLGWKHQRFCARSFAGTLYGKPAFAAKQVRQPILKCLIILMQQRTWSR
jgi:hypothetical protein